MSMPLSWQNRWSKSGCGVMNFEGFYLVRFVDINLDRTILESKVTQKGNFRVK